MKIAISFEQLVWKLVAIDRFNDEDNVRILLQNALGEMGFRVSDADEIVPQNET